MIFLTKGKSNAFSDRSNAFRCRSNAFSDRSNAFISGKGQEFNGSCAPVGAQASKLGTSRCASSIVQGGKGQKNQHIVLMC